MIHTTRFQKQNAAVSGASSGLLFSFSKKHMQDNAGLRGIMRCAGTPRHWSTCNKAGGRGEVSNLPWGSVQGVCGRQILIAVIVGLLCEEGVGQERLQDVQLLQH